MLFPESPAGFLACGLLPWELPLIMFSTLFSGIYVPIGGKQMITFMDDFNMPAKDTFGSQPPLELIKLWLDYGFWYDRTKQTIKYVKVCFQRLRFSPYLALPHR